MWLALAYFSVLPACGLAYQAFARWREAPRVFWLESGGTVYSGADAVAAFRRDALLQAGIAIVLFLIAGAWVWKWRHERRFQRWQREGRCLRCGYLLCGIESARCPECGTPIAESTT